MVKAKGITSLLLYLGPLLLTTVSGCAPSNSAPTSFCGLRIDKSLYSPLFDGKKLVLSHDNGLPVGDGFSAEHNPIPNIAQSCAYREGNGNLVISAGESGVPLDQKASLSDFAQRMSDSSAVMGFKKIEGPFNSASWEDGSFSQVASIVDCPIQDSPVSRYVFNISAPKSEKDLETLQKLITSATKAYLKLRPCETG